MLKAKEFYTSNGTHCTNYIGIEINIVSIYMGHHVKQVQINVAGNLLIIRIDKTNGQAQYIIIIYKFHEILISIEFSLSKFIKIITKSFF